MPKKIFKKMMPKKENKFLKKINKYLTKESFSYQRIPILKRFFIGTFIAFLPLPFQMVIIRFLAIWFKANVPIGITLAWITNPISMPFIFFLEYKIGDTLLNGNTFFNFRDTFNKFDMNNIGSYLIEMYLGSIILASLARTLFTLFISFLWKIYVIIKRKYNK